MSKLDGVDDPQFVLGCLAGLSQACKDVGDDGDIWLTVPWKFAVWLARESGYEVEDGECPSYVRVTTVSGAVTVAPYRQEGEGDAQEKNPAQLN